VVAAKRMTSWIYWTALSNKTDMPTPIQLICQSMAPHRSLR
jgi:hypothetical protein